MRQILTLSPPNIRTSYKRKLSLYSVFFSSFFSSYIPPSHTHNHIPITQHAHFTRPIYSALLYNLLARSHFSALHMGPSSSAAKEDIFPCTAPHKNSGGGREGVGYP